MSASKELSKKRMAGKSSGVKRAKIAKIRQFFVLSAFERLKPSYQMQPFADESLDALEAEFHRPKAADDDFSFPVNSSEDLDPRVIRRKRIARRGPFASKKSDELILEIVPLMLQGGTNLTSRRDVSRDMLKKDLIALGVRSKLQKKRSG